MKAVNLKTEYLISPIGLDETRPRLSWICDGGITQTAYRIVAERQGQVVWDTGKVASGRMTHIRYSGLALSSRDEIIWQVRLWDENDDAGDLSDSSFELGFLDSGCWQGQWITGDYKPKKNRRYPVDCFRKAFKTRQDVVKARLYITACGLYEAKINGQKAGKFCLAPGCTDYRKRIQYQVYDVTGLIRESNQLEVQLADGWYRGSIGAFGPTNIYGRQTKLLCQVEIMYADGSAECIGSDDSFDWSSDGPIRFADLKDGEVYDAALKPRYSHQARVVGHSIMPSASNNVSVVEKECFRAKLLVTPSGRKILDFGQNIAGFIKFSVQGAIGQEIRLRMGEILDDDGEFTQKNIQLKKPVKAVGKLQQLFLISGQEHRVRGELVPTPKQEISFFCSGQLDHYKTTFSVFGFRYAEIESDIEINPDDVQAIAVYSDMEQAGEFSCSNQDIDRFLDNTSWSMKGNFLDIPTDCPTRERLGWTGDAQIFLDTAADLMTVAPFFRKWLVDLEDSQLDNGKVPAVVPYVGIDMIYKTTGASVGWGDAAVLIPFRLWKRYGDDDMIKRFYPLMRKYAMYMIKHCGAVTKATRKNNPYRKYTYEKGFHYGEWLEPKPFKDEKVGAGIRRPEEGTAYLHVILRCMTEIANRLNHKTDERLFSEYADGAIKAYDWLFLKSGTIDTDRQAKLVRPLALGLLSGDKKRRVQQRLVQAVQNNSYCIGTGFLSTPFILPVLTEAGRVDVAYKMIENTRPPSWLAEVKAGATTVWENWDGEASRNHYSPGAVCDWLFSSVAGICVTGENCFKIQPHPGGTLTYAKASYRSIYGAVSSYWKIRKGTLSFWVSIPANTTADIILPTGDQHRVFSGEHAFSMTWPVEARRKVN